MTSSVDDPSLDDVRTSAFEWLHECRTAAIPMGDVHHGRTLIFDSRYDEIFTALPGYATALAKLEAVPHIRRLYGEGFQFRILLGLAFETIPRMVIDEPGEALDAVLDEAWRAFMAEALDPEWHYLAVANLGGIVPVAKFDETLEIALGVRVAMRTREFLESLGDAVDMFRRDWSEGGHSELVLIAEGAVPKTPDNVVNGSDESLLERLTRTITAMRLARQGGLRHGVVFCLRRSRFLRLGGVQTRGNASRRFLSTQGDLRWDDSARVASTAMYQAVAGIEPRLGGDWGSIAAAIRSYQSALNRTGAEVADKILDSTTALEALVGDRTETVFKVRLRLASLLGDSDDDVRALFVLVGRYYDLRSTVVHGDVLKPKHQELLLNSDRWLEVARLAICAFMKLAHAGVFASGKKVREEIDTLLIHGSDRTRVRAAFAERWSAATAAAVEGSHGRIVGFCAEVPSSAVVTFMGEQLPQNTGDPT